MTERDFTPAAPERDDAVEDDVDESLNVDELRSALERARAQYQRAVADYQNLQRRYRDERAELARLQMAAVVGGFLPVMDDLERAIESADEGLQQHPWLEGIRLVAQKFRGVIEAAGIEELHALSQPFDPEKHEAVGQGPGPEGAVVHIVRKGYTLDGRVVRPAMVIVGRGAEPAAAGEVEQPTA